MAAGRPAQRPYQRPRARRKAKQAITPRTLALYALDIWIAWVIIEAIMGATHGGGG
jgi:hypothetical protein